VSAPQPDAADPYAEIYRLAEPYWHVRRGEVHVPEVYALAQTLVAAHPDADPAIVLPAALLHDVGYALVPADDLLRGLSGAANGWDPDITRRHEIAGAKLAGEILERVGWDPERTRIVQDIVDGHDSRREAVSLEDALVKDADKVWRFTESGVRISHPWMQRTTADYMDWVESRVDDWLFTDLARAMAREELAAARIALAENPV
jgi:hypothetical protein